VSPADHDGRATAGAEWEHPAALPSLGDDEIHVWRISIAACAPALDRWMPLLDADERARHARFHFQRDRDRFVVGHAVMRLLLAHYGVRAPTALEFTVGKFGKPFLVNAARTLEFNMSDSGDIVLAAVSAGCAVGVDVEVWSSDMPDDELTLTGETAFSAPEQAALAHAAPPDRRSVFFTTWSRKEAYLKATGDGVTLGLDHFDVSADPHHARLLVDRRAPGAAERWGMHALDLGPAVAGALVWDRVVTPVPRIRRFVATPSLLPSS
jgi:4'-phosphopantetheinyl transferase